MDVNWYIQDYPVCRLKLFVETFADQILVKVAKVFESTKR